MSQRDLAEDSGIRQALISQIERGRSEPDARLGREDRNGAGRRPCGTFRAMSCEISTTSRLGSGRAVRSKREPPRQNFRARSPYLRRNFLTRYNVSLRRNAAPPPFSS
ncbi:helix-turn-helix domain-containing protein [Bradyrhizobium sp. AZCC 1678]|uniref:helix-turn-helix domain-containing protein n=1 Tax=Bradyrhizobium sp. AZCC 1678 TaxID=3117030 RepID=UPI002FF2759A